jgi:hypothetical protein
MFSRWSVGTIASAIGRKKRLTEPLPRHSRASALLPGENFQILHANFTTLFRHSRASGNPVSFSGSVMTKTLNDSRHPWRSPFRPPLTFAFAVLQTQSQYRFAMPRSPAESELP